jgi:hypothetical protein
MKVKATSEIDVNFADWFDFSGPGVGGPYGPYKQVIWSCPSRPNLFLTVLSPKERHYIEIMPRNCYIPVTPIDVFAPLNGCIHLPNIRASLVFLPTTIERVHIFPRKSQMIELQKGRPMSLD